MGNVQILCHDCNCLAYCRNFYRFLGRVTHVLRKKRLVDGSSLMTWPNRNVVHRMRLEAMTQLAGPFDCDV